MLKTRVPILLVSIVLLLFMQSIHGAVIGSKVSNFRLSDASGNTHNLSSYAGKVVVLVFWSYKCAASSRYSSRIELLQNKYDKTKVILLGVSTGKNETAENILKNKANLKVTFPVLLDTDGNLADSLNATRSPSVFIIDGIGRLRYQGALDNNKIIGQKERSAYSEDAIDAILNGRDVAISETEALGCSIRRSSF